MNHPSHPGMPARIRSLAPAGFIAALLALALVTGSPVLAQTITGTNPVKIFILAGESNMHGKGTVSPATTQGTLDYIVANDPTGKYQFLKSGANYVTRADVGIRGLVYSGVPNPGNLTINYGGLATGLIGPELGFGHVLGDAYENKVLIVKVGVDGTTLAGSFCPPSSRVGDPAPVVSTDKGFYYKEIIRLVNEAKTALGATPYEIAGLGWHQGWNDRVTPAYSAAYETNMANFITDIRTDLATPNMPIVIATAGMDGYQGYSEVENAQLKMANPTAYPAFAGNVAVVDTRINYDDLEFWQSPAKSPANEGYHWNRSGKTYLHIGMAMGDAISLLAPNRIPYRIRSSGAPGGTTITWKNGTETPTSVRVLRNGVEIAASAPANPATFVDASPPLGVSNYELQFTMPGNPTTPLTISHNSGITNLVARLRVNGAHLSWQNNLGYAGLTVKRDGIVIAASLPGSTTSYVDIMPPAGLLSYTVEPTTAGSTPAQASLKVSAHPAQTAVIYEPFDMTAAALLEGQKGGLGLDGDWVGGSLGVTAGNLAFGTLPTYGNRLLRGGGNGNASITIGTTLTDAGLLADGAVLWFSFLHREPDGNINTQPALILGSDSLTGYFNEISSGGSGIGVRIGGGKSPQPISFNAGAYAEGAVQSTIATSQVALIIGKITWGATPGAPDTVQIYTPGTDLTLDTPTSLSTVLNQANFNVISMWGNGGAPEFDEIRFGASYLDVTGQGVNTSGDFTPPTPVTMSWASPPAATSQTAITMTATTASDANGVQYQFLETSGNPGATSSGWQDSPVYTDTGLNPNTQYSYTVQARDKSVNNNPNTVSSPASATTFAPDGTPPTPDPMTWATPPAATGPASITMTATTASDVSGVEYSFDETSGNPGGTDSGWQDSPVYTDAGLSPSTTYTYQVNARDKAPLPNETAPSSPAQATTQAPPVVSTLYWDGNDTTANADGGAGTWADGSNNWDSAATAGLNIAWNNSSNDTAVFGGTAGTVTVGTGGVTVGGLQVNTASYVFGNYTAVATGGPALSFGVAGNIQNNVSAVISAPVGGAFGLSKTGTGLLELRNTANTFTGNINVGGGTLRFGQESSTAGINDIKLGGGNFSGNIAIATGAALEFWSSQTQEFSGIISGAGSVNFRLTPTVTLSGANTYTGKTYIQGRYNGQTPRLKAASLNSVVGGTPSSSLGAPATVADGTIELGIVNLQTGAILEYTGPGETTDRVVNIPGAGTSTKQIINSGSGTLTFISPMTANSGGWTDTELQIDGTGNVVFQNFNAPGRMEAIIKRGAGTWSISGPSEVWDRTELYGGTLSVTGAISDGGILYPASGGFVTSPSGKPANQVVVPDSSLLAVGMTVSHGRLAVGTTITQIIDATTIQVSNNAGGPANIQERGTVGFVGSLGISPAVPDKLRWVNSATLRYHGPDDSTNRGFLIDAGDTATWDIVGGVKLTVSGNTTATTGKITKAGDGALVLNGNLLHTGTPNNVTAGTLLIDGNASAMTGSVDVASGATFGGRGTLGGNLNIASGGKLTFDFSTPAGTHDRLDLSAGKTLTFSGASTLTITSSAGAAAGDYTLVTAPGGFGTSVPPATVIVPAGWTYEAPRFVGNDLRINITSTGGSAYDTWKAANAPGSNPDDDSDGDGVENAVEFVLGGTAATKDLDKLPKVSTSGTDMLFTFYRKQTSIDPRTSLGIEVGTDLVTWNIPPSPYAVPDGAATNNPGVTVEKDNPAAGTDKITLRVAKAADAMKFARLRVAISP